eukprot:GEMP01013614.1.p1 GENE.GEMP01013614.1~~GEMP01013614.1.p1  ORF type:complete len:809 (-),score=152.34 GEMP01013614.1:512-2938(-)
MIPVIIDTINRHFQRFAASNDGAVAIVLGCLSLPQDWPYKSEAVVNLPLSPLRPGDAEVMRAALRKRSSKRRETRQMSPLSARPNECVSVWSPTSRVHCAMMKDAPSTPPTAHESAEVFIFEISPKAQWEVAVFARSVEVRFCPAYLLVRSFSAFRADKNLAFADIVRDLWRNARDLAKLSPILEKGANAVCVLVNAPAKGKKTGVMGKGTGEVKPIGGKCVEKSTTNGNTPQEETTGGKGGKQRQYENIVGKGGKQAQEKTAAVNILQGEAAGKAAAGSKGPGETPGDGGKPRRTGLAPTALTRGAVFGKGRKTKHDTLSGGEMMKNAYAQLMARKGGKSDPSAPSASSHIGEENHLLEHDTRAVTLRNGGDKGCDSASFPQATSARASASTNIPSFPRPTSSESAPRADGHGPSVQSTTPRAAEWNNAGFFPRATSSSVRQTVPFSSTATPNSIQREWTNPPPASTDAGISAYHVGNSSQYHPAQTNSRKRARTDSDATPANAAEVDVAFGNSVRSHYNDKTRSMRPSEEDAKRGGLRKFNNMIKGIYLRLVQPKHVLDLACGHGQELLKFNHRGTIQYIGLDSSNEAISEALRRYGELKKGKIIDYKAEFHCRDVREASALEFKPSAFNLVCCNFALHYIVSSEVEALELLSRVNSLLKVGGFFALTIVCSDVLEYRLGNRGMQFGNDEYAVSFAETDKPLQWGRQYEFRFGADGGDGGIKHTEFAIPRQAFCKLATSNGFDVVVDAGFCEMFGHYYKDSPAVADWYGNSKNENFLKLSAAERELVALYRVVMLRKRRKAACEQI